MKDSSARPADGIEEMIEKYGDMLYRLCVIMLKNESDAEDTVQETVIKYYRKAPIFQNGEHEKAWLIRVAANGCKDVLRKRKRRPQTDDACLRERPCEASDSGIMEALEAVPEKFRLVLTLYYVENVKVAQIARMIGRTESTVKMRLQKGRRLLEKIYREEYL